MSSTRRKRLTRVEVQELIKSLLSIQSLDEQRLMNFAEKINGAPFKVQPLTMSVAKNAVLGKFGCSSTSDLRKNKTFLMSVGGEEISLRSKSDWLKQYRRWVAVPEEEREKSGPTCINGIDVLENFRPWHIFGLDPNTATSEDVKSSFRELAKKHHPDTGGDPRDFERIQKMRDSILALMN